MRRLPSGQGVMTWEMAGSTNLIVLTAGQKIDTETSGSPAARDSHAKRSLPPREVQRGHTPLGYLRSLPLAVLPGRTSEATAGPGGLAGLLHLVTAPDLGPSMGPTDCHRRRPCSPGCRPSPGGSPTTQAHAEPHAPDTWRRYGSGVIPPHLRGIVRINERAHDRHVADSVYLVTYTP